MEHKVFNPYTAKILSSPAAILRLEDSVARLTPQHDFTAEPKFFLASISVQWSPRVVVVTRSGIDVGVVYAKERRVAGLPTGLLGIDGRLGNSVVADAADADDVLRVALDALFALRRVHGLVLLIPPAGAQARVVANTRERKALDITYSRPYLHARLPLPPRYEEFVESLGYKTRRNFRYYRRKFEEAGHVYVDNLSFPELRRAVSSLQWKCRSRKPSSDIRRSLDVIEAAGSRWIVGLRHRDGEWLAVASGWRTASDATMFFQLNSDRDYAAASLSVVLRAYLIEMLIEQGTQALSFWSGSAFPLSQYAVDIPAISVHLEARTLAWRLIRSTIRLAEPRLARWFAGDLRRFLTSSPSVDLNA